MGVGPAWSERLIQTAVGIELIHNASLIHDDIIDGDEERRGLPTLNRAWGNKIALLVGDALYSHAFGCLTRVLPSELLLGVVTMNANMCSAEIEQAQSRAGLTTSAYYRIIEGKTAAFMSVCCALGGTLAEAPPKAVTALRNFGMQLGMAYQLFDDSADGDLPNADVGPASGMEFVELALGSLKELPSTQGREALENLCGYLVESNSRTTRSR